MLLESFWESATSLCMGYMSKHIFEYVPNRTTVFTREYLSNCKERLQPKFSSCFQELQEVDIDETEGQLNLTVNTKLVAENEWELDKDIDKAVRIFEFSDIPSYVAVISLSLNKPAYYTLLKYRRKVELLSHCLKFMGIILQQVNYIYGETTLKR